MTNYGTAPLSLGEFYMPPCEAMHYLYMPIKLAGGDVVAIDERLRRYQPLIGAAIDDAVFWLGQTNFTKNHYLYITAKTLFVTPSQPGNRDGWHVDGYGSNGDLNYIWSDENPTEFAVQDFQDVPDDDQGSMKAMTEQARDECILTLSNCTLARLDESVVHRVGPVLTTGFRSFVKISVSRHRFNNAGNTTNYNLEYQWIMNPRNACRNLDATPTTPQ